MAEMAAEGDVMQVCRWTCVSRRNYYCQSNKAKPNEHLAARVKRVITNLPYGGYRTVVWLLGEDKNTIQRLFQTKDSQVRKRRSGTFPGAGITFGGLASEWALVNRHCTGLMWSGSPLAHSDYRYRLLHPRGIELAAEPQRQRQGSGSKHWRRHSLPGRAR